MELRLIVEPNAARLAAKRTTTVAIARGALAPRF
jgi:DNA-binding FadR family transcriptional regulator